MKDLHSQIKVTQCVFDVAAAADANGTGVDCADFMATEFVVTVGNDGVTFDGTNYLVVEMEESDDNSAYTDCAQAAVLGATVGANGAVITLDSAHATATAYRVGYRGNKRYARPVLNFVGTHGVGTPVSIVAVQHGPRVAPVDNQNGE